MTAAPAQPFADLGRALATRAPDAAAIEAPFAPLEATAHQLLPQLAALRAQLGNTPLVPVASRRGRGTVWLKTEAANTTGTVKARTAYALLCAAVARAGSRDIRLVEYSGGSLALALAEMCAALGIDLHLALPHGSPDRLVHTVLRHGAQISFGAEGTGFLGAMGEAVRVAAQQERHLLLQHCAAEAAALHRERTGAEIVARLTKEGVEPVALAAAVGSGGTLVGTAQALRATWPGCAARAVLPAEAPYADPRPPDGARRMNGTGGLGHGLKQPLIAPYEADFAFDGVTYPNALHAMHRLRQNEQLAVCASGAGAWLSASRTLDEGSPGRHAVAIAAGRGTAEEWAHATGH
ncbi:pyridoxal-phosphate dependent enzyme [Streptomyces sp. NPDC051956]|uniref:pyridoxal-phosphate dependent enzyme n=1 Tax=Streptomyces sp. NPDC051956 TaxID=3365677 RepID=UPI0037CF1393